MGVVIATSSSFHGTTPVCQTESTDRHRAAASSTHSTFMCTITHFYGRGGGWGAWRAGGRVGARFDGVGGLHGDPALTQNGGRVPDETDVSGLAPIRTPGVLDNPVGGSGIGSVSDCQHTVVELGATRVIEYALGRIEEGRGLGFRVQNSRFGGVRSCGIGGTDSHRFLDFLFFSLLFVISFSMSCSLSFLLFIYLSMFHLFPHLPSLCCCLRSISSSQLCCGTVGLGPDRHYQRKLTMPHKLDTAQHQRYNCSNTQVKYFKETIVKYLK